MKKHFKHLIICMLVITSVSSAAQSFISKGTVELGGDFSFSSQTTTFGGVTSKYAYGSLMFNPYVGVMVLNGFELGFAPEIINTKYGSSSITGLNLFFAPAYNFNAGGKAFPYLEFLIGYDSKSGSGYSKTESGLGVGFSGGVKVAIGESSLFIFNVKYLHQNYDNVPFYNDNYFYVSSPTTVSESINTVFAGVGFRIFITSKSGKAPTPPGK